MMMKRLYVIICMSVLSLTVMARQLSEQDMIKVIARSAEAVSTLQCDIVQTKHMRMMRRDMVSKGSMKYCRTDRLRWEYTSPYAYTFLLNGTKVVLCKDGGKDVVDVARNKMMKEITSVMIGTMTGTALTDAGAFEASVKDDGQYWTVTLLPRKKDLRRMYTTILLMYNPGTGNTERVEMTEKNGDRTVIELKNIVKDKDIDAKVFQVD